MAVGKRGRRASMTEEMMAANAATRPAKAAGKRSRRGAMTAAMMEEEGRRRREEEEAPAGPSAAEGGTTAAAEGGGGDGDGSGDGDSSGSASGSSSDGEESHSDASGSDGDSSRDGGGGGEDDSSSKGDDGNGSDSGGDGEETDGDDSGSDGDSSDEDDGDVGDRDGGEEDSPSPGADEPCAFDLGNLLAMNTHQVDAARLHRSADSNRAEWYKNPPTISSNTIEVDESLLLAKAADGTAQLLRELWRLPTEKTDAGPMAKLPGKETKLPRALPPPPPKQLSKWEQFARQRGIAPKSKRSRKVYDEATGEWKHLTGSSQNKANAGPESWPILEVKKNDDPTADPWERLREEKKARVGKNVENRMRNAERAGTLERGSANRLAKSKAKLEQQREAAREKERRQGLAAPAGVPLDMKSDAKRGKPSTQLALRATQTSTASLGRFDKMREGEPEKRLSVQGKGKRKKEFLDGSGGERKRSLQGEAQKSADILQRVMSGSSSKEKERDVKRGKYAHGETAYDYDYNDGLGASTFRKKKGRAGMGKIRKFTKKRIK